MLNSLPDPSKLKPKVQLRQNKTGLSSLKMEEPFMIFIKAGLIVGAVFTSPMIFYHLWSFVAAGLHTHERKYVYIYLPVSVVLFISGVALAFFLVLHYVLSFLLAFNGSMDVAVEPRLTYYVNFVLLLPLGFGIAYQLAEVSSPLLLVPKSPNRCQVCVSVTVAHHSNVIAPDVPELTAAETMSFGKST